MGTPNFVTKSVKNVVLWGWRLVGVGEKPNTHGARSYVSRETALL